MKLFTIKNGQIFHIPSGIPITRVETMFPDGNRLYAKDLNEALVLLEQAEASPTWRPFDDGLVLDGWDATLQIKFSLGRWYVFRSYGCEGVELLDNNGGFASFEDVNEAKRVALQNLYVTSDGYSWNDDPSDDDK